MEFQFLNRRSTSPAGLRLFGKTCELRMLDCLNRTCAAGLRHSVRPANCKRSPLTGLQVPNMGHPKYYFSYVSFPWHISLSFSMLAAKGGFFRPSGRPPAAALLLLCFYALCCKASQPTARIPAEPFFFFFLFRTTFHILFTHYSPNGE